MGILNTAPNSFSSVGRFLNVDDAVNHAKHMVAEGAAIIDIGGEPTNPGVHPVVSLSEELERVIPVLKVLRQEISVPISVDTSKPEVMEQALAHGANFINDVRALQNSNAMKIVAKAKVPVCLMHMFFPWGKPSGFSEGTLVDCSVETIIKFLETRIEICLNAGIAQKNIFVDPGIGGGNFGKSLTQNLEILKRLEEFKVLGVPILIGVSRKTFIGELLNLPVEERLYGSLAAAVFAVSKGASIIRTHDVRATVDAIKLANAIMS